MNKPTFNCEFTEGHNANWDPAYLLLINGRTFEDYPKSMFSKEEARNYAKRAFYPIKNEHGERANFTDKFNSSPENMLGVFLMNIETVFTKSRQREDRLKKEAGRKSIESMISGLFKRSAQADEVEPAFQKALILMHRVNMASSLFNKAQDEEALRKLESALNEMKNYMLRTGAEHMKLPKHYGQIQDHKKPNHNQN